jgi:hypothetical protein
VACWVGVLYPSRAWRHHLIVLLQAESVLLRLGGCLRQSLAEKIGPRPPGTPYVQGLNSIGVGAALARLVSLVSARSLTACEVCIEQQTVRRRTTKDRLAELCSKYRSRSHCFPPQTAISKNRSIQGASPVFVAAKAALLRYRPAKPKVNPRRAASRSTGVVAHR